MIEPGQRAAAPAGGPLSRRSERLHGRLRRPQSATESTSGPQPTQPRSSSNHIGGNTGSSTFRFSLAALLFEAEGWKPDSYDDEDHAEQGGQHSPPLLAG